MPTPRTPIVVASRLLDTAEQLGVEREALCAVTGFNPRARRFTSGTIPLTTMFALWEEAIIRLRDPAFPMRVAATQQLEMYGVLALTAMTSMSLQEAFARLIRFYRLWTNNSRWELERRGATARVAFIQPGEMRLGQRCDHEFSLAEMASAIRQVTGRPDWAPTEVRFAHARPRSVAAHEAFFRAPLVFAATRAELVLAVADLELPMIRADRLLSAFFERHSEQLIKRLADAPDEVGRIKRLVLEELRNGAPRLATLSAKLAVGTRTLRRRLDEEGTSFKRLVDEARSELAREYLRDPQLTIGEVVYRLGFSEPSAFYRAFRRWTGESPLKFRERSLRRLE